MITEKDLIEAIAECQGQRNPNSNTCIKLAAFYTILDHIKEKQQEDFVSTYSYSPPPEAPGVVAFHSDSDFSNKIQGMKLDTAWSIMDDLMDTLSIVNPRLYDGVMRKIEGEQ